MGHSSHGHPSLIAQVLKVKSNDASRLAVAGLPGPQTFHLMHGRNKLLNTLTPLRTLEFLDNSLEKRCSPSQAVPLNLVLTECSPKWLRGARDIIRQLLPKSDVGKG